jgi:hypothetical protein
VCEREREREGERERKRRRENWVEVRDTTMGGGIKKNLSWGLKVPRQCPLVLLVGVKHLIRINLN